MGGFTEFEDEFENFWVDGCWWESMGRRFVGLVGWLVKGCSRLALALRGAAVMNERRDVEGWWWGKRKGSEGSHFPIVSS